MHISASQDRVGPEQPWEAIGRPPRIVVCNPTVFPGYLAASENPGCQLHPATIISLFRKVSDWPCTMAVWHQQVKQQEASRTMARSMLTSFLASSTLSRKVWRASLPEDLQGTAGWYCSAELWKQHVSNPSNLHARQLALCLSEEKERSSHWVTDCQADPQVVGRLLVCIKASGSSMHTRVHRRHSPCSG